MTESPTPLPSTPLESPTIEFGQIEDSIAGAYSSLGEEVPEFVRTKIDHCNGQNLPENGNVSPEFAAGSCQQVGEYLKDKFHQTQYAGLLDALAGVERFYNQRVDQLVEEGIYPPEIRESEKENAKILYFTP